MQSQPSRKRPFQDDDEFMEEDFELEPPEDDLEELLAGDLEQVGSQTALGGRASCYASAVVAEKSLQASAGLTI